MASADVSNSFVHLTNVAVQKRGPMYDADSGGKWHIRSLKLYLTSKYGVERVAALFAEIQRVVVRALQSVQKVMVADETSFALYGYDILIDDNLKVWLLEVNACPSLTANTAQDYKLKFDMLSDALTIVDVERKLLGTEEQVGCWDLIYKKTEVGLDSRKIHTCLVGAANNRGEQLPRMWAACYEAEQQKLNADKDEEGGSGTGGGIGSSGGGTMAGGRDLFNVKDIKKENNKPKRPVFR